MALANACLLALAMQAIGLTNPAANVKIHRKIGNILTLLEKSSNFCGLYNIISVPFEINLGI